MGALVDTNLPVYAVDPREPEKQPIAERLLSSAQAEGSVSLAHQCLVEFVAVTARPRRGAAPLLDLAEARRSVEDLMTAFPVLYPNEEVVRLAFNGVSALQLSWFDAHLWAHAEHYGLDTLYSEDFQHGRRYGRVRVVNPFV